MAEITATTQSRIVQVFFRNQMSFDLYIQSFRDGVALGIPHHLVRQIFGSHLSEVEPDFWTLSFGPYASCFIFPTILDDAPDDIQRLNIGNPCDHPGLWECLFCLMGFGQTVLYFPGGPGPLVLGNFVTDHMPRDLLESIGQPVIVKHGQDIQRLVFSE